MTVRDSGADRQSLLVLVQKWAQENLPKLSLVDAEQVCVELSREVARALLESALTRSTGKESYQGAQVPCDQCGGPARFMGYRSRWVRTLCGDQEVGRAYYHCARCHRGQLPWDRAAGLNERIFSPGLKALVTECCARLTHREVEELLARVVGLEVEESSQQELVGEVGGRLRAAEAEQIEACFVRLEVMAPEARADPAERLYVGMDAAKAHTNGGWHDVKCAAVYRGERPEPTKTAGTAKATQTWDRAGRKSYVARQEVAAKFGERVYVAALAAGLEQAKEVVVLGDGAEWIWNLAAEHFHGATEILDYYHAAEHIWKLAPVLYGEGSPQGKRWAEERCRDLKTKGPKGLLCALARRKPRTEADREALRLARGYFREHRKRMNYPGFRARGMMIGSGPVEAACKVIVGQRLKGAGMRWSEPGADAMLAARTAVLNRQHARIAQYARAS